MNKLPHWQQLLAVRGILKAAQDVAWKPDGNYWRYPVYNLDGTETGVYRKKKMDTTPGYKYLWDNANGHPEPLYYVLPGFYQALQDKDGYLILSSGEPDTLAYRSAGAMNVLSWFGEKRVPESFARDMLELGVKSIEVYPDCDKDGHASARKMKQALVGTGIDVYVYGLPAEYGSKFDINKLWQMVKFDKSQFWMELDKCPKLEFELEIEQTKLPEVRSESSDSFPDEFYREIELRLGVTKYKANGYSEPVKCPLHDDEHPSAGWHRDKHILKCLVCHGDKEWALATQVADKLGIAYRSNLPVSRAKERQSTEPRPKGSGNAKTNYSYNDASDVARRNLFDETPRPALPIVWRNITDFGGFASLMPPKKMWAVVADSGGGKTSAMETQVDHCRRLGYSVVAWSPEWGVDELVYRTVQRLGGPSLEAIMKHTTWKHLHLKGVHPDSNYGKQLSDAELKLWSDLDNQIRRWAGKIYFIDQPGTTIDNLAERISEIVNECAVRGEVISLGMFDYMQLLDSDGNSANDRVNRAVLGLKNCTIQHNLVSLVGSQITKEGGKQASTTNGKHDMQNLRSDVFNLVTFLSRRIDSSGNATSFSDVYVNKNNLGRTGKTALEQDTRLMIWKDCVVQEVHLGAL